MTDVGTRTATTMIEPEAIDAALRMDIRVVERAWTIAGRRLELLVGQDASSQRTVDAAERLAMTATAASNLADALASDVWPEASEGEAATRWPMRAVVEAAQLAHRLRLRDYAAACEVTEGMVQQSAYMLVRVGLGQLLRHGERYAVEGVGPLLSMAAALSMAPHSASDERRWCEDPVELRGPVGQLFAPIADLILYSSTRLEFRAAFVSALTEMARTVLAATVCNEEPTLPRSAFEQRVGFAWILVTIQMGVAVPDSALVCWQQACSTIKPSRLSRCARCERATCTSTLRGLAEAPRLRCRLPAPVRIVGSRSSLTVTDTGRRIARCARRSRPIADRALPFMCAWSV